MISSIAGIKDSINAVYVKILEQVDLKTGSKEELIKTLDEIKEQEIENERFIGLMKKLLAGVPIDNDDEEI